MLPDVKRTLDFWFEDGTTPQMKWFRPAEPEKFDRECRDELGPLVDQARSGHLDSWTNDPESTLALVILLDQIPRNIFRKSAESYSSDKKAFHIATQAIAKGFHQQLLPLKALFLLLPLEHDEQIISQIATLALLETLHNRLEPGSLADTFAEKGLESARQHRDVIARFGRFPSRNQILGRQSTAEEEEFLRDHPTGF